MRQVNLVNDQDEVIGQAELLKAHLGTGQKHQAVSLFLFHRGSDGLLNLLMQQRSNNKIVGAKQWANTLCANLIPGENHEQCVRRRLLEELGVFWKEDWSLEEVAILDYQVSCENGFSENEMDHFFVMVLDEKQFSELKLTPNPNEVVDTVWLDWPTVKSKQFGGREITPWFNLFLDHKKTMQKVEEACQK